MQASEVKLKIQKAIFDKLINTNNVLSVTIVGSFVDNDDLSGISDIDTVVICKNLNRKVFNQCVNNVKTIDLQNCGLSNHELLINTTFGPLKFDRPKVAVIHLMIYDIYLHR